MWSRPEGGVGSRRLPGPERELSASTVLPTFALVALDTVTVVLVAIMALSQLGGLAGSLRAGAGGVTAPRQSVTIAPHSLALPVAADREITTVGEPRTVVDHRAVANHRTVVDHRAVAVAPRAVARAVAAARRPVPPHAPATYRQPMSIPDPPTAVPVDPEPVTSALATIHEEADDVSTVALAALAGAHVTGALALAPTVLF